MIKLFGLQISRIKTPPPVIHSHVAFVVNKRGKAHLFVSGKVVKQRDFTVDFWVTENTDSAVFPRLVSDEPPVLKTPQENLEYAKSIIKRNKK